MSFFAREKGKHERQDQKYQKIEKLHRRKHQHAQSYTSPHILKGALIGTWHRMRDNTIGDTLLIQAIKEKWLELQTIGYKLSHMHQTIKYMENKTNGEMWTQVLHHIK